MSIEFARTRTLGMGGYTGLKEPECTTAIRMTITVVILAVIGFVGIGIIIFAIPLWNIWAIFFSSFGVVIVCVSALMGHTMFYNVRYSWNAYYDQQAEWHAAVLRSYENENGMQTTETISLFDLDPRRYGDMIAILHCIYERQDDTPFTRRALEQPLVLDNGHASFLIGELKGVNPERTGTMLSQLGIIKDRGPRNAGTLVPDTFQDAVAIMDRNWGKVSRKPQ